MKRFKNILVVYNDAIGADDALTQATALARANRARLTLVDVLGSGHNSRAALAERQKRLQRTINALKPEGIRSCSARVLTGTGPSEIVREVERGQHDMVIASAEGGIGMRNGFYASSAVKLMRKCPCPVWTVKAGQTRPYGKVLVAVDPDVGAAGQDPLDVKIMDMATSLAASHGAELHVLHAWDVTGKDRHILRSEIRDETRQALLDKHEALHRAAVEDLLARYRPSRQSHVVHLPRGLPELEIGHAADGHDIDLIVMGAASRKGLSGLLIGNAAESLLSAVRCGILTVKPDTLVSSMARGQALAAA